MTAAPPHTSAATSDDIDPPKIDARVRLLLWLIITATLPRVLLGLVIDSPTLVVVSFDDLRGMFSPLRALGLIGDVASVIIVAKLHVLDEGDQRIRRCRRRAVGFGVAAVVVPTVGAMLASAFFGLQNIHAWLVVIVIPGVVSLAMLALWLGALLRRYDKRGLLTWVAGAWLLLTYLSYLGHLRVPFAGVVVGALTAFEIARVRRAVTHG